MIGSSAAMAMAIVLLVPVRMSDTPGALGLLVFVAALLIAAACAMQLSAVIGATSLSPPIRAILVGGAWVAAFGCAAWAMSRAPGGELVMAMMLGPPAVGLAAVIRAPSGRRWHAVPFLALAIALALLVFPAWLERLGA